jgi:hypothetical protein
MFSASREVGQMEVEPVALSYSVTFRFSSKI